MDLEKIRHAQMLAGERAVIENLKRQGLIQNDEQEEAKVFSSNTVLADSLLADFPENRPLYKDSGLWQMRSDDMEEVIIQQGVNEKDADFIARCKASNVR